MNLRLKLYSNLHCPDSELKDGVAVTVPGPASSSPLLLAGLALSLLFNLVVGGYVLSQLAAARRVDTRWAGSGHSQVIGQEKLTMITRDTRICLETLLAKMCQGYRNNNVDIRYLDI